MGGGSRHIYFPPPCLHRLGALLCAVEHKQSVNSIVMLRLLKNNESLFNYLMEHFGFLFVQFPLLTLT